VGLNVRLEFRDKKIPELTDGVGILRVELFQEMSEAFSLTLVLRSPASQIDMAKVVGEIARVRFFRDENGTEPEPFVPLVEGMVRRGRQLSTHPQGGKSTYELVIVHQLWLLTRGKRCGISKNQSAAVMLDKKVKFVNDVSKVKLPPIQLPTGVTREREYTVQYNENDYDFHHRVLAEDGVAYYFTGEGLVTPTLVADTSATRSSVQPSLPYLPTADALQGNKDAVIAVEYGEQAEPTAKMLRDYHFDNPSFHPKGVAKSPDGEPAAGWADYSYEEGSLHAVGGGENKLLGEGECNAVAQRRLEELRRDHFTVDCRTTCPLPVGAQLTITGDHPIANTQLTVVRALTLLEYPEEARDEGAVQIHRVSCIEASFPYRPLIREKARIHGIQRAIVIGSEHIDVDKHGRVLLAFFWDLRNDRVDNPSATSEQLTRRVPVSHGWAGLSHGFVTLPRTGDEVLVAYIDGDPDEPVVVGRVYNGQNVGKVALPRDKTQSLWRTESSPGRKGFHEIRFEDLDGKEELHIEAQRLHTRLVKGAEQVNVHGSRDISVGGNETETIHEDHSRTVFGSELITVHGDRGLTVLGEQNDAITDSWSSGVGGPIWRKCASHTIRAKEETLVKCASRREKVSGPLKMSGGSISASATRTILLQGSIIVATGDRIELRAGGSVISLGKDGITIKGEKVTIN
jgi:type VI secretion system secreted protein VgrG